MCGRYAVSQSADDLAEEFGVDRIDVRERLQPDWNIAPSKQVYAVLTRGRRDEPDEPPERRLRTLRWGLVPSWAKDASIGNKLVNARLETAAEKPSFRRAFAARRCLLPAEGFYEWRGEKKGEKQPFFIHPKEGSFAMAGLYEIWRDKSRPDDDPDAFLWSVVILTTDATDDVGQIHDRMPMLVEPDGWERWLDPSDTEPSDLTGLLKPAVPGILDAYPVSTEVNRVANNGPHLLDPVTLWSEPIRTTVPTPIGDAAFWTDAADEPRLRLVLGHGAGGGPKAADLDALARTLPSHGVTVIRFEQPWRLAGKKVAPRPPVLDEAWLAALGTLPRDVPLVLGGRSSGARVACRTAPALDAVAVVALAFPLHLPGRPEASRLDELVGAAEKLPVLVVQGERDSFGGPGEFPPGPHRLVTVPNADHGMRVLKGHSQREALDSVVETVRSFLDRIGE